MSGEVDGDAAKRYSAEIAHVIIQALDDNKPAEIMQALGQALCWVFNTVIPDNGKGEVREEFFKALRKEIDSSSSGVNRFRHHVWH